MGKVSETDLYEPVKRFLEDLGYEVKSEVGPADVVGVREGADPVVVELKAGFSLKLLRQGVARLTVTDQVWVAVPKAKGRAGAKAFKGNVQLCRRLGLGVLAVRLSDGLVEVHADPEPYTPRKSRARRVRLMREFARRRGDPNTGGTQGSVVTAYRQDAEALRAYLREHGPSKGAVVAKGTGVAHATRILRDNHYGWFENVSRGIYRLAD